MSEPKLSLSFDPPGPVFAISENCQMPAITAKLAWAGAPAGAAFAGPVSWEVRLTFRGGAGSAAKCPHCGVRSTSHQPIAATTNGSSFRIPFTQVRGGDLTVKATAQINARSVTAVSSGLRVVGTNPSIGALSACSPPIAAFRKLVRLESGLRQFRSPSCPLWSADNLGGVGLCQLTPAPSEDAVWNWRVNLDLGVKLYKSKQKIAKAYPGRVRSGHAPANLETGDTFLGLVEASNAARRAAGQPELQVTLPDFDDEQLQRDTLRGFNGWAGGLHEYRVKLTDAGDLDLVLVGNRAFAQWEAVTSAMRREYYDAIGLSHHHRGDPNYVEDALSRPSY